MMNRFGSAFNNFDAPDLYGRGGRGVPPVIHSASASLTYSKPATHLNPSRVVFVGDIIPNTSEVMLRRELQEYGRIDTIYMIPHKHQALIMFSNLQDAEGIVSKYNSGMPIYVRDGKIVVNFSKSTDIKQPKEKYLSLEPTRYLLMTVFNIVHDVNCDIIKKICSEHGKVQRIIIFKFTYLRALVEFSSVEDSQSAKQNLNGADIYEDCNTLRVDFCTTSIFDACSREPIIDEWNVNEGSVGLRNQKPIRGGGLLDKPAGSSRGGGGGDSRDRYRSRSPPMRERSPIGHNRYDYRDDSYGRSSSLFPSPGGRGGARSDMEYGNLFQIGVHGDDRRFAELGEKMLAGVGGRSLPEHRILFVSNVSKQMNCDKLFNILSLYGNVSKIKFLIGKEGTAMAEMFTPDHAITASKFLNGEMVLGNALRVHISHQVEMKGLHNPANLDDGTLSVKDYSKGELRKGNRFLTPESAAKNRPIRPTKCAYVWGMTDDCDDDDFRDYVSRLGAPQPEKIEMTMRKAKTAVLLFESIANCIDFIAIANNTIMEGERDGQKYTRVIKICFSNEFNIGGGPKPGLSDARIKRRNNDDD